MEVDSLVVSLGLDPQDFRAALNQVRAALQNLDQGLRDFGRDFANDGQESIEQTRRAVALATQQADQAARDGRRMGDAFENAGNRGSRGVTRLADSTARARQNAKDAAGTMRDLGRQWGGFLQGIVSRFAAPVAGALSVGAVVGSYLSGVSQVAQMYGRWTPQMEEWRKKQELLSRVNREDIELYRKAKLALMDFRFAMAGLSTTIMRALSPVIRAGIELLHQVADWVRRNEPNIIRFVTVLAGVVTAVLLPAIVKLNMAMLMNPITWIIAGIIALALVIDDLVTYIRGGESAFEDLWALFGTGEEIAESLGATWNWLKGIGANAFTAVSRNVKEFFEDFDSTFTNIKKLIEEVIKLIQDMFKGDWEAVGEDVRKIFEKVGETVMSFFTEKIERIKQSIVELIGMIPSWEDIKEGVKGGAQKLKEGAIAFGRGFLGKDEEDPDGSSLLSPVPSHGLYFQSVPSSAELTRAAVSHSVTNTTNKPTTISNQTTIGSMTVTTSATDAEGLARDMGAALRKEPLLAAGVNAADGGVVY